MKRTVFPTGKRTVMASARDGGNSPPAKAGQATGERITSWIRQLSSPPMTTNPLESSKAGQHERKTVEEIDEARLERVFRTNIFLYFFMVRHSLKHMKQGGSIINTTSVNAYKGNVKLSDYTSTKGAIVGFTRGARPSAGREGHKSEWGGPGSNMDSADTGILH